MPGERTDIQTTNRRPPLSRSSVPPPSAIATAAPLGAVLLMVALILIALSLIGGWFGLVIAILLMLAGVFGLTRYVRRIAWTRNSSHQLQTELPGTNEDPSVTDEAHGQISLRDVPADGPAHRELHDRPRHGSRAPG